jgi:thiol:disulfide interchange protein
MNIIPKTTLLLSISMGLIFSLFLLSCARTSNSQQNEMAPLVAALKILDVSVKDTISVQVEFTLKNMTANNLEVLKWGTPFEGEFSDDMFDVRLNGKQIRYTGIQVKRGTPQGQDYVKIGPHEILSATLLLEKGYALEAAGQYSVQYSKSYVSVRSNGSGERLIPIHSNQVVFIVPE